MSKSLDDHDKLRELLDREAIRDLPRRYCHYVWQEDVDAYFELFSSDGWVATEESQLLPRVQSREAFRELIEKTVTAIKPKPFIHNHVIELCGPSSARGTCYVEVRSRGGDEGSVPRLMVGWYEDEYVKMDGNWKFKSRIARFLEGYGRDES